MTIGPYYFNGSTFPTQAGKPVTLELLQFHNCCCPDNCCDEVYLDPTGEINLPERYPYIYYEQAEPWTEYPYPNGQICLGPFLVPVRIQMRCDGEWYADDYLFHGEVSGCERPTFFFVRHWPYPGEYLIWSLLPAYRVYKLQVVSVQPTAVGIQLISGTYLQLKWWPEE